MKFLLINTICYRFLPCIFELTFNDIQRWPQTAGHSAVSPVQYKILKQYKLESQ